MHNACILFYFHSCRYKIVNEPRKNNAFISVLHVAHAKMSHAGDYRCTAFKTDHHTITINDGEISD